MFSNYVQRILNTLCASIIAVAFVVAPATVVAFELPGFGFSNNFPSFEFGDAHWDDSVDIETSSVTSCKILTSASVVDFNDSVTISWETQGFDSIVLKWGPLGSSLDNEMSVSNDSDNQVTFENIQQDTKYELVATNANGDTCRQSLTVGCLVPVVIPICESFSIAESTVDPEGDMTFSWNTTNVSKVSFNNGIGEVPTVDGENQVFSAPVTPGTYTYTLTFDGKTNHSCVDTIKVEPPVTKVCVPGDANYNPEADLTGYIFDGSKGKVTNTSHYCAYDVGLASYEKFDEIIDNQKIFDYELGTVGPKAMIELHVDVPLCAYQIDLFYGDVLLSLDGQRYGTRLLDAKHLNSDAGYCGVTEEKEATVVAEKVVCTDESQLPNWGAGGPNITANTAADWVAANSSCSLEAGWEFEWTADQSTDPGDTLIGRAGAPWSAFGPTNASGRTQVTIDLTTVNPGKLWFREVLQTGFIPFTHGLNGQTNVDNVSAEFYCNTDVINYDNRDFIAGLEKNKTYHCVAFNAPIVDTPAPQCVSFLGNGKTALTITEGDAIDLTWDTLNATQILINNAVGDVTDITTNTFSVAPSADTTYELTVIGEAGTINDTSCKVPVTVHPQVIPGDPSITIDKNDTDNKDDTQTVAVDGTANFEIVVTNTGSEDLVNVVVTDPLEPTCNQTIGSLAVGASSTYTCSSTNVQAAFINVANVTGESAVDGQSVDDTDPTTVEVENTTVLTCSDISISASDTSVREGNDVTLEWVSTGNVSSVSIDNGIGSVALTGSREVRVNNTTTYNFAINGFNDSESCPITISATTGGGGGGGSSSPRCELEISDTKINRGDEITLTWDSSRARELILTDDRGNVLVTTEDKLSDDKDDLFEGEIRLNPTRDTEYTLRVERGSRDRECTVDVEMDDEIVLLQTRDQAPLVAGISLTEVPYTGFEAGSVMTFMFYALLVAWALYITYVLVIPKTLFATAPVLVTPRSSVDLMSQAESARPDVFSPMSGMTSAPTAAAPANLPVAIPAPVLVAEEEEAANTETTIATEVENEAHLHHALLSSGAVQSLIEMTTDANRSQTLTKIISDAKGAYPLEDGWVVINQTRLTELTTTTSASTPDNTSVTGNGSLAEAIVVGNVVAAYQLIGNRPMFALADASADLDALYRNRKGATEQVSDLLTTATKDMTDSQIADMITALTGAIDGTYTDEASAVKMAIMKAVKIAA